MGVSAVTMPVEHVAAIRANSRPRRSWRVPRPRTADGYSIFLAVCMAVGVPLWFMFAPWDYEPRTWGWNVPGQIADYYLIAQIFLLLTSAGRSDRIGMNDTVVSLVAFIVVFATAVIVLTQAVNGRNLSLFQVGLLFALVKNTFFELVFTAWMRFLVNRRYFATAPASVDDHHDQ